MTTSDNALPKAQLRRQLRQLRRDLDAVAQLRAARQLSQLFCRLPCFRRSKHVALYWACDGEVDMLPVLHNCWRAGKAVFLPCLSGVRDLEFRRYRPGEPLHRNRFGIPEPRQRHDVRPATALDLVVMPLVAFDRRGVRLGMGGGYYDRALSRLRRRGGKPFLVGAAHSFQEVETLPGDHWDVPLHGIITERGFTRCYG